MSKIVVLGAGMVGSAMAIDLSKKHNVTSIDINEESLKYLSSKYKINTLTMDVTNDSDIQSVIKDYDIVISAVPGFLGLQVMKSVINAKKDLIDISFLPEDVSHLDGLAKENNVTVIMDCGVAPGMPNYIAGYYDTLMEIEDLTYVVGGLPKVRSFPFEYKAPFSPCDVVEEYTRPARYIENGKIVVKPAMSDPELLDFDKIGTLEAFNTDGLRSLIYTLKNIPNMKEKTLRFPGHIRLIQAFKSAGFFDYEKIEINGVHIIPFDFTTKLLFKSWKLGSHEPEFTVMRIVIKGNNDGKRKEIVYDLYDEYDPVEDISSMARTTGFTATATAQMVLDGKLFNQKGVFPPEIVGKMPGCLNYVFDYLKSRNITYQLTERILG